MGKKTKNQTVTAAPYQPVQQYLTGNAKKGITGILPEAESLYEQYRNMRPEASWALSEIGNILGGQAGSMNDYLQNEAIPGLQAMMRGGLGQERPLERPEDVGPLSNMMDTAGLSRRLGSISPIQGAQIGNVGDINLGEAWKGLGGLNPAGTMQRMLSGQVDRNVLDPQAKAITDMMTRNMKENVLPGLRSEAMGSGQYGSSRQGIAEGLAASRLNQDLSPALTNLYGTAFENAQSRAASLSNALSQQALSAAGQNQAMRFNRESANAANEMAKQQFNTNLGLQAWDRDYNMQSQNMANELARQQFNANLGLQRNQQLQQDRQMRLNEIQSGADLLGQAQAMQIAPYQQIMNYAQYPQQYALQNLQNYSGLIQPIGSMGQTQTTPMQKSGLAGLAGGALGGGVLASMGKLSNPWIGGAAALGGLAGLLG